MNFLRRWIVMGGLLLACLSHEVAASTNALRIGVPWSPGSKGMSDLKTAARSLSKKTDGRVRVKFVEQHELDSGPIPCDGVLLLGPRLSHRSPASRIFNLPLFFRSSEEVARLQQQMDAEIAAELEAQGFAVLAQMDLGFAYLHSTSPLETVAQLKSARLWVPPVEVESIQEGKSYGVTLVPMEAAQVREALRQGTLDAVLVPPLGAILLQWHAEFKSVLDAPFLCLYAVVILRQDTLAALDAPDQVLLREELALAFSAVAAEGRQKEPEAFDVLEKNGVVRCPLGATPEQRAEWEAWSEAVVDRLVAEGILSGDTLARARQSLKIFRKEAIPPVR